MPLRQPPLMLAGTEARPTKGLIQGEPKTTINRGEMIKKDRRCGEAGA